MMKRTVRILSMIGLAGLLLGIAAVGRSDAVAADAVTVSINAPAQVVEGDSFTVTVDITNVTAFDAGQFDVSFDESLIQLDSVTAGLVGTTQIPIALWNEISAGTCRIIVNVPGVPGVNGSGYLAILNFHAASSVAGSSSASLSNGFLNDKLGSEITATWVGDSVDVCKPKMTPRPGDADGDGAINAADITTIERIIVGLEGATPSADATQDGAVNTADITAVEAIAVRAIQLQVPQRGGRAGGFEA